MLTLCKDIKIISDQKPKDPSSLAHSFSDIHILAVDDSLIDRKVIERLLKTASYKVTTADTALRALEVLGVVDGTSGSAATNAIQVNLILTDYCMPGMTGYDLLRRVKETSALKEIPVVIMSTEDVPDRISMCLADGAEEFILKPLRLADVKRLKAHVRQRSPPADIKELKSKLSSDPTCEDEQVQVKVSSEAVDTAAATVCPKRKTAPNDVQLDKNPPVKRPRLFDD
ncbi:hypothetical protein O6H91_10G067500 [Diphasiastrum complanatum]|uniref:Uncharacterized protein n=1 Tax=Diphasiastrum complanatum TaxID=34168 RepID=A0ACC2CHX3_DIPCM|nr:hypothetical protein O6H91_10G067500 [Diphasiastrum complanatum]